MILYIDNNRLIDDLQEQFSDCFPGLKIEFYTKHHGNKKASVDADLVEPSAHIGEIRRNGMNGPFTIKSTDSVKKVEDGLYQQFGLNVQVFRNERNGWIQTTNTDRFSLAQQMKMSQQSKASLYSRVREQFNEYVLL